MRKNIYSGEKFSDSPASPPPGIGLPSVFTNIPTEHCIVLQVRNSYGQNGSLYNNSAITQEINLESDILQTLETPLA